MDDGLDLVLGEMERDWVAVGELAKVKGGMMMIFPPWGIDEIVWRWQGDERTE